MAFATGLAHIRYLGSHLDQGTWLFYHQAPPLERVLTHMGRAGKAIPHRGQNPLVLLPLLGNSYEALLQLGGT